MLHLQPLLGVEPLDALVIGALAGLAQLHGDQLGPVPTMAMRQGEDLGPQGDVSVRCRRVPQRRGAHPDHAQSPPPTQSACHHVPHHHPACGGGHHCVRNASRITSISSRDSASSFFSVVCSAVSSFSRLPSETLSPPSLLRLSVGARLGEPVAAAELLDGKARLRLLQEPDDLRFRESLLHVRSPLRVIGLYSGVLLKKG